MRLTFGSDANLVLFLEAAERRDAQVELLDYKTVLLVVPDEDLVIEARLLGAEVVY